MTGSKRHAVVVEKLGKRFTIGVQRNAHPTLREALMATCKRPLLRTADALRGRPRDATSTTIWAFRDISFSIEPGEVVGIIGRNGAGKSTLLKVLARITQPTEGEIRLRGRVGSLLEVGTGFHPELTGRENVFLAGSILGMRRAEIRRKFHEIVSFAEVELFIDTPVKRYSSGMLVRLGFAVAAHLEPEILIVDEVLAVGDAAFQKRCLSKMESVSRHGRTVLFVSHNMNLVQTLCQRAILLSGSQVSADDQAGRVVTSYLQSLEAASGRDLLTRTERVGAGKSRITRIEMSSDGYPREGPLAAGHRARFVIHVSRVLPGSTCSFTIYDLRGQPLTYFDSASVGQRDDVARSGENAFVCEVDTLPLLPGRYRIDAAIGLNGEWQDEIAGAAFFDVEAGPLLERVLPEDSGYGSIFLPHRWSTPR